MFRQRTTERAPLSRENLRGSKMSLQYVEPSSMIYPPSVIFARGGGTQKTGTRSIGQGAGKPAKKAAKKAPKKAPKKAAKKAPRTKKK
jgi:hypothetical protein